MAALDLILFSLSLLGVFFGILVSTKCKGKLRTITFSLTFTLILFGIYGIVNIISEQSGLAGKTLLSPLHFLTIALILFTLITLNQIISSTKSYTPRKKREKIIPQQF